MLKKNTKKLCKKQSDFLKYNLTFILSTDVLNVFTANGTEITIFCTVFLKIILNTNFFIYAFFERTSDFRYVKWRPVKYSETLICCFIQSSNQKCPWDPTQSYD